jgi:hypothetical protein
MTLEIEGEASLITYQGGVMRKMFLITLLGIVGIGIVGGGGWSALAGETSSKMEKSKGKMNQDIEETKGEAKALKEEMKGNDTKAELERAKGKTKGAGERAKGEAKGLVEKAK